MKEYRCRSCGALLFKGALQVATVEIKCWRGRCGAMNVLQVALDRAPAAAVI